MWKKSDDAQAASTFGNHLEWLRIAMGLPEQLAQYAQRREYAECIDSKVTAFRGLAGVLTLQSKLLSVGPRPRDVA